MTEKTVSKYLLNIEKQFANDNAVLLKATKVFHELDQIEYDLGLLDADETTASKCSWWPIVSLISGSSAAKPSFMNQYLGSENSITGIQTSSHKFTVLLHNNQAANTTLPGTALDVDHRYPFFQISQKIEQLQKGEGDRLNSYLELKTIASARIKGKLLIDMPNFGVETVSPVVLLLAKQSIDTSDLVLVFTDIFEAPTPQLEDLLTAIRQQQDTNKFVYLINETSASFYPSASHDLIASWQTRLSQLGLNTGQFIVLPNKTIGSQNQAVAAIIDQRLMNISYDRSYRVLNALEHNIREVENSIIPEVKNGISVWKDRSNFSSLLILSFFATLAIFAEIETGILDILIDPIIGPAVLLVLIAIMMPVHLIISKVQSKLVIYKLGKRQKELHIIENLAEHFEKGLTFGRILLPIKEPYGWNKKTKAKLSVLSNKVKDLVQLLNDSFGSYYDQTSDSYPGNPLDKKE
ncbi:MAG: hypothetical protein WC782_02060 [Methylococcaceae bacterium]|jgi:hypothetical protein